MFTTIRKLRASSAAHARVTQVFTALKKRVKDWPDDKLFPVAFVGVSNAMADLHWVSSNSSVHVRHTSKLAPAALKKLNGHNINNSGQAQAAVNDYVAAFPGEFDALGTATATAKPALTIDVGAAPAPIPAPSAKKGGKAPVGPSKAVAKASTASNVAASAADTAPAVTEAPWPYPTAASVAELDTAPVPAVPNHRSHSWMSDASSTVAPAKKTPAPRKRASPVVPVAKKAVVSKAPATAITATALTAAACKLDKKGLIALLRSLASAGKIKQLAFINPASTDSRRPTIATIVL